MSPADHRRKHDAILLANRQRAEIAERARAAADRIAQAHPRFQPFPSEQFRRVHITADAEAQAETAATNRTAALALAGFAIGTTIAWACGFTGHLW